LDSNLKIAPLISVVMSVFNGASYLREAIESVLQQTYKNFEFIIINDGSIDESLSIIKSYSDNRILCIENDGNKGLIYSLNKGIKTAKGQYIARMDADDISLLTRFQKQVDFLETHPNIGVCSSDYIQFSKNLEQHHYAYSNHEEILSHLLFNSSLIHPSLMIRKSCLAQLDKIFDDDFIYAEDYELWSRLIFKCQFSKVPDTLLKYRLHDNQVTQRHRSQQMTSANSIRKALLLRCGFQFSDKAFEVHCLLGNSQLLTSIQQLHLLLEWFHALIEQNKVLKIIDDQMLLKTLNKYWYDACGITNIGLDAFTLYIKSHFYTAYKGTLSKLLAKCIIRKFKSA
jgi:glycosyltransferase involved in cell wall biosynthesis